MRSSWRLLCWILALIPCSVRAARPAQANGSPGQSQLQIADPDKAVKSPAKGEPSSEKHDASEGSKADSDFTPEKSKHAYRDAENQADEPIPGSDKWELTHSKKNSHKCVEDKTFRCCDPGSDFDVEKDECEVSRGYDAEAAEGPSKKMAEYQNKSRGGKFQIPNGIDHNGMRGCTVKNAVSCHDQLKKKLCCCNLGFIFDFSARACVVDQKDPENKEDPIPGSQTWGWGPMKRKPNADKCINNPKKWCCHRQCKYEIANDACGACKDYDEDPPTKPWDEIKMFQHEKGQLLIPNSIDKPKMLIGCSTKNSKKCTSQQGGSHYCCCHQGLAYSFEQRLCVDFNQWQQEQAALEARPGFGNGAQGGGAQGRGGQQDTQGAGGDGQNPGQGGEAGGQAGAQVRVPKGAARPAAVALAPVLAFGLLLSV
mmetsp:Transcript_36033/g.67096  ORF Transcript_36033/g.67096 Transcript_36033/m.67096 type:complete len:426 (-) Transcript_36033:108-1385(-)